MEAPRTLAGDVTNPVVSKREPLRPELVIDFD